MPRHLFDAGALGLLTTITSFFGFTDTASLSGLPASMPLTDPRTGLLFGATPSNAGPVLVNEETVLGLATVYRCVDVLSSSFASLSWDLFKKTGAISGPATGHPNQFLTTRPHPLQTSFVWRKTLFAMALLWGDGFARIIRDPRSNRPLALKLYHHREVTVLSDQYRNEVGYRFWDLSEIVSADEVIHLKLFSSNGLTGRSVIRTAPEFFQVPLQAQRFTAQLIRNGARPDAAILHDKGLSDGAKGNIKTGFSNAAAATTGDGRIIVLDEGMKYQNIGINPADAQLLQVMELSQEQICALFGVPQHMAGILRQSTNNNIEHQGLEYVAYSLKPHVINFQQEYDYKTLRQSELGTFFSMLDLDSLQLQDLTARQNFFAFARTNGIMSADEIRDRFNMNPVPGGDLRFIQGAMVPLDTKTGLPIYPPKPDSATANTPKNGHSLTVN